MSAIAYATYEDSPIDYFPEYGMKGTRTTLYDIETDKPVLLFDFYATEDTMYWLYFEVVEGLRNNDWLKYLSPFARADIEFAVKTHARPKAVWLNVSPELKPHLEAILEMRKQFFDSGVASDAVDFTIAERTYVSGAEMSVYERDGTRKS